MIQKTGKVRYRYLQKYYKPENVGDPLVPVLDNYGNPITKLNVEGDKDYYPDTFDFDICGNEAIVPPVSTTTKPPCPLSIQGISINWFSPEFNIVSFELSNSTINSIMVEVIKGGDIVYTVTNLVKEGTKFNLKINKFLTGEIKIRVVAQGCIAETTTNIDVAPPSTTTTVDNSGFPCYDFPIFRKATASGPEVLEIKYTNCKGITQILRLPKGGNAVCIKYLFKENETFIAVYPEQQQYINAGDISIGVVPC